MRALLIVLALASACAGPTNETAPPLRVDAGPPPEACALEPPLELGRCRDASDGTVCTGDVGEVRVFEPMPPEGDIAMVIGPQAATMFVLAARTTGIDPGNPADPRASDNPSLELTLSGADGEHLSFYRGRSGFSSGGEPDTWVQPSIFVVVDAGGLSGRSLEASATLRDASGRWRCGELAFVAGTLDGG